MTTTLELYTPEKQKEVLALLGLEGPKHHLELLFQLGEKYHLDILTKEITLIPKKGPFIGVWGRLHIAHRSGKLDGLEMDDEWETDKHYCVRIIVWRKDMGRPAAKVIGRVGKHEGSTKDGTFTPKEWPLEIARARGLRAGLGFAFSIHDAYDQADDEADIWVPAPDERVDTNGTIQATVVAGPTDEKKTTSPAPAPAAPAKKTRRVNKKTGEVIDAPPAPEQPSGTAEARTPAEPPPPDHEPPTIVVGGHTLAQRIAMAARNAGVDDDQTRHDIIRAATDGKATRGQEVTEDQKARVIAAFDGLADGTVELRYAPDGTPKLFRIRR